MYSLNKIIRAISLLGALVLAATAARAVDPPPDGGYPNNNTAEGGDALFSLTTADDTAMGFYALDSNTSGSDNAPASRNWTGTGSLNTARDAHTATLLHATAKVAAPSQSRQLFFADRVAYQRAIEEVYWRHRIWPKERPDPKPPLDAVMSQTSIEKKAQDYLRQSELLEQECQKPITPEQLQAEMERMATHSKQPEVLRELFAALGNDPFVIA